MRRTVLERWGGFWSESGGLRLDWDGGFIFEPGWGPPGLEAGTPEALWDLGTIGGHK